MTKGGGGSKLNPPLTILIPNISHHAIARSSSNLVPPTSSGASHVRRLSSGLSDKTIPLEVLNPNLLNETSLAVNPSTSFHDYENLALININRNAYAAPSDLDSGNAGGGVRHWKTYNDMAEGKYIFLNDVRWLCYANCYCKWQ